MVPDSLFVLLFEVENMVGFYFVSMPDDNKLNGFLFRN